MYEYFVVPLTEEESLAHYGVKGMKWGVRRNLVTNRGGGTLKVGFRPTYNDEERRNARSANKSAKKTGSTAIDREGFDSTRIGKLRTPSRRLVNFLGGTKWSNVADAAAITTALTTMAAVGLDGLGQPAALGALGGAVGVRMAGDVHRTYATYFNNMKNNPNVKLKTSLTAKEMADYQLGKTFVKQISSAKGSTKISVMKSQTKIEAFDREGRKVGGQTLVKPAPKVKAPVKKAS